MTEIRIATLNLHNFTVPPLASYEFDNIYSAAQWLQKTTWLQQMIGRVEPDIIFLQEVFSVTVLQQLLAEQGYAYFGTVAEPVLVDQHVYQQPVVALASRFPLSDLKPVEPCVMAMQALGLTQFRFSRAPLSVIVDLPGIGPCRCYGVHLKSRRALELTEPTTLPAAAVLAQWGACVQRGHEAALLLQSMSAQRHCDGLPVILAGDLNDELASEVLQPLREQQSVQDGDLQLFDSWDLQPLCLRQATRPATHYYGARGSVLDYILCSADFQSQTRRAVAEVLQVQVFDSHLTKPDFATEGYSSDHAMVCVTLAVPQSL